MSLFDNDLSVYEQFRTFFPYWLLEFYEFDEILKCQASMAEKLQKTLDLIIDNHFMDYMDENTITQFERFLNINSSPNDIEFRRNLVKAHFLGQGKLSMYQIISIVEILTGGKCEGVFVPRDESGNNEICLTISNVDIMNGLVDVIKILLERIPAHLWLEIVYKPPVVEGVIFCSVFPKQTINSVAVALSETNILYGGPLNSEYYDVVNCGTLADDYNDTIDGNY